MEHLHAIPIGNLLSQMFALIYLNPLDHFVKRELKARRYLRYVDDFVLIGLSRDECLTAKAAIEDFLRDELRLGLSKSTIQKVKRGLNFVGYRTWRSKKFICKHSLHKFSRAVRAGNLERAASLLGHAKGTASFQYMMDKAGENYGFYLLLPESHRRLHHVPDDGAGR